MAQGTEFPLRKPAGFHWDFFLLGLTTGVAGILGIPFPNGLIPQAPFHTAALCVTRQQADLDETMNKGKSVRVVDHVVEQRVSNLAQGLLTLGMMAGPLLIVLHLIPQGVMAGLFFIMGVQALLSNGITQKLEFLAEDSQLTPALNPLKRVDRRIAVWAFVAAELIGFGATFAITQTVAAIGFPIIILLLVPIRSFLLPKWFKPQELAILDAPTASPLTMESVGGSYDYGDDNEKTSSSIEAGDGNGDANNAEKGSGSDGQADEMRVYVQPPTPKSATARSPVYDLTTLESADDLAHGQPLSSQTTQSGDSVRRRSHTGSQSPVV